DELKNIFYREGRDMIFNKLFDRMAIDVSPDLDIEKLVFIYRNHMPCINLYDGVEDLLSKLKEKGIKLGLLTDGMPIMQKNKVKALGLEKYFDEIVYSWEIGCHKPSESGIKFILNTLDAEPETSLMVGDNPKNDIEPAVSLGMKTVRLLRGRFADVKNKSGFSPDFESKSIDRVFSRIMEYV